MKKKNYTTPALSVEEFEMTEVICTSPFDKASSNVGFKETILPGDESNPARGKGRGIWEED